MTNMEISDTQETHETWLVRTNVVEHEYAEFSDMAYEAICKHYDDEHAAVKELAEILEEMYRDRMPQIEQPFRDLLESALFNVSWYDIALEYVENELESEDA